MLVGRGGEGKGGELSRKSMHLIRIEIIDKKFALISTIEIKNALELTTWWWWWWGERIKVVRNRVYPRAAADDKITSVFVTSYP